MHKGSNELQMKYRKQETIFSLISGEELFSAKWELETQTGKKGIFTRSPSWEFREVFLEMIMIILELNIEVKINQAKKYK